MKKEKYLTWKRKNVTLRGVKDINAENGVYGSFGKGLYTASLSNREMAKQYGKVFFVVNGRPKNPKKFQNLNNAEIFRQRYPDHETMQLYLLQQGFNGLEIQGREMVNYTPENVLYFENENQLINYYENNIVY